MASYCMYLRKSRADAEAEMRGEGETLARHEKALKDLAQRMNLNVAAIYREIVSGESIAARPQMQKLLTDVENELWDGVIVMDIDRLARGNGVDQGIISQTFQYAGTKIITPSKIYDPNNEFDEEYFEFGLFMSRREYKIINRRLQRGRLASVKEGKFVCSKPPYGYGKEKIKGDKGFKLSPVPEQAEIVKNIFKWYTIGKTQENGVQKCIGASLIARELNSRGIKSYSGGVWTASAIRDILINPVYIGKICWNRRPEKKKMIDGKIVTERPRADDYVTCDGLHEPIISTEIFEKAQQKMQSNKRAPIRGDKSVQNPFASLIVCQKCGRKMQRKSSQKNPDLIMCTEPTCDNHASYLELVENRVLNILKKWAYEYVIQGYKVLSNNIPNPEALESEISDLTKAETALKKQLNKTYEAFETGIYDAETFLTRSDVIKSTIAEICTKKAELQKSLNGQNQISKAFKDFIPKVKRAVEIYPSLESAQLKNETLKEVIERIDYIKKTRGKGHEEDFEIKVFPKLPKLP